MTTALTTVPRHPLTWQDRARCNGLDTNCFYPAAESRHDAAASKAVITRARKICRPCPVRMACLAYALQVPPGADWGVWGGTSRFQRAEIRAGRMTVEEALAA